jgi:drug/metabolite transporter (DMT)-like permease
LKKHLALLSYLTVCIVWGSTYLAIRVGVTDMPFMLFAGIRFTAAGSLILILSRLCRMPFPATRQGLLTQILIGLLLLFVSNGLICWAEQWLESGMTALLVAATPLFMASIDNILPGGQRTSPLGWCGLFIGFGGVAALVSPGFGLEGYIFPAMLAVLGASLVWSVGSVWLRRRPAGGSLLPSVGLQMLTAGIAFLFLAALSGNFSLAGASPKGLAALLYLIFIGSILAYSAFIYMIKIFPAAKAGTYAYINPVVAVILGALILREEVALRTVLGAAVILGGVVLVQFSKVSPAAKAPAQPKQERRPAARS